MFTRSHAETVVNQVWMTTWFGACFLAVVKVSDAYVKHMAPPVTIHSSGVSTFIRSSDDTRNAPEFLALWACLLCGKSVLSD